MVKLLTLADLGGLADLAEGEEFLNVLEINMEKSKNKLTLNEILALGPSICLWKVIKLRLISLRELLCLQKR